MILSFHDKFPQLAPGVFVAHNASIIGAVEIAAGSSVWFGAVIRGDLNTIKIGEKVSIQDNCVLHIDKDRSPLTIGNQVTVGHRAVLHGCSVGSVCLIGMGAVILDDVRIGDQCIIGAGSVVAPGTQVPPRTLMVGVPARPTRELTEDDIRIINSGVEDYFLLSRAYLPLGINPYAVKEMNK